MFNGQVNNVATFGDVSAAVKVITSAKSESSAQPATVAFTSELMRVLGDGIAMLGARAQNADDKVKTSVNSDVIATENEEKNAIASELIIHDEQVTQALNLIASALVEISKLLGIAEHVETTGESEAGVIKLDNEGLEQLTEIMAVVDKVLSLLEKIEPEINSGASIEKMIAEAGLDFEPFNQMKNTGEVAELASQLRTARAHIGFAISVLNLQEIVAEKLSAKVGANLPQRAESETPLAATGIAQAASVETLGMSVSDIAQVFSGVIKEDMANAMERLKMIMSGDAEMTELERAALKIYAANSGIVRAATENSAEPLKSFDFKNVNLKHETNAENSATIKNTTHAEVPVSASDVAPKNIQESVEHANVRASLSVNRESARIIAASSGAVEIPTSVSEMVASINKATANTGENRNAISKVAQVYAAMSEEEKATLPSDIRAKLESLINTSGRLTNGRLDNSLNTNANANVNANASASASANASTSISANATENANANVNTSINASANISVNASVTENTNVRLNDSVNANVNANANASANANVGASANASAPSSESGNITVADAEKNILGEAENESAETETEVNDDVAAKVESTEAKNTNAENKADKLAQNMSRLEQEELIKQLTERMHFAIRNGAHEIRMILRPEALGEVRMSIRMQGDVVMAKMLVESRQVKAIVESNMQSLKDELAKHNLNLDNFSVDVGVGNDNTPPQKTWREMSEGFERLNSRNGRGEHSEEAEDNFVESVPLGTDTGKRYGFNTFEYFV